MQLVEQHCVYPNDPRWQALDAACFLSKNLYNAALYELRQHFFATGKNISYSTLAHDLVTNIDFCALPRKVSQWVLRQVYNDWHNFWKAQQAYQIKPQNFTGRPKLPHYKHKSDGRNLLIYTTQAISRELHDKGILLRPSQLGIQIQSAHLTYHQIRISPRKTHYLIEVIYTREAKPSASENVRSAAIDIGLNNLATVTSDQPGFVPLLVNGRPLKSINQYYNKERARLQAALPLGQFTSKRLEMMTDKRHHRIKDYLHRASCQIVELLLKHQIGTLVIGKNKGWKQGIELGSRTNQSFVQLPHAQFIEMLTYKAQLQGICVIVHEESYTSKCSFLDHESVGKHDQYAGKRVKRGLFRTRLGKFINADVNASYNILRKVIPKVFSDGYGIAAAVVQPVRMKMCANHPH